MSSSAETTTRWRLRFAFGLALVAAGAVLPLTPSVTAASGALPLTPADRGSRWELVFHDEFNGSKLDERKWRTEFPWGRDRSSVGELQWYAPDAFRLSNGRLRIVAEERNVGGHHDYTSGLISSHRSFTQEYGYFEIRARVPRGKGLWPAFWLLPVTTEWPPEIDVFEILGHDTDTVHMHVHYEDASGRHQDIGETFTGHDFSRSFHTFAVKWGPSRIVWFVDGVERHRVERDGASPSGRFYVIANLAVGGDWPGEPNASTTFPAFFDIDYIRVYRKD